MYKQTPPFGGYITLMLMIKKCGNDYVMLKQLQYQIYWVDWVVLFSDSKC